MTKRAVPGILQYGAAILSVAVAFVLSVLTPLHELSPSSLFFAAVMVSSFYGGLGPGLVATVLSVLAIDRLMAPSVALLFDWGDMARMSVFTVEALLISSLNASRKRLELSLQQQNEELRAAHRYKDEFLATLAHELRNPLSPISNGFRLLRQRSESDEAIGQICEVGERQVLHMSRLVEDLLDISRIGRGKVRLRKAPVELADIVNDSVEASRPLIASRRHDLSILLPEEPIWLDADATRLKQMMMNLLSNAAKYTPPGGRILVSADREDDRVTLRVRDTGMGISPELLPRIFDLFAQAERSLDHSEGGLGIGLSLVKGLVEVHGGKVEAHSDGLGQGSEFVVELPALREAPPPDAIAPPEERVSAAPRRILIVDDNDDAAQMLAMLLEMDGHEIRVVHDGRAALEEAPAFLPDAIVLDIELPGLNGYQVARRLRQSPLCERVLLVALTGHGHENDRRRSQQAGFDHHLVKPVDFDALQRLLADAPDRSEYARIVPR